MEKKYKFLLRVYFGVSDNPNDDVNPYDNLNAFESSTVGELFWGENGDARGRSKIRFSYNYVKVLEQFGVFMNIEDVHSAIENDETSNSDVVNIWLETADFS